MNKTILVGRLTREPDARYTQNGKAFCSFTLAVDRFSSQGQKEADFIPVVVWGKVAEVCGNNLTKGRKVLVDGRLQVRSYEDKTGQKRYVTEVIAQTVEFLERQGQQSARHISDEEIAREVFPDDDVPF